MTDKPIFLIGSGRSGSTVLHELLSYQQEVAWCSNVLDRLPSGTRANRSVVLGCDVPVLGSVLRWKVAPAEAYGFWDLMFPGFRRPIRDLCESDVTPYVSERVTRGLGELRCGQRQRLLMKITGWPRIGFLKQVFPDAYFVHLVRDGRAVANSLMKVAFWMGWRGPENWRWGPLPAAYEKEWLDSGHSFVVLAGIQWKMMLDALERTRDLAGPLLLEVRYEDLCAEPRETLEAVCAHCDLKVDRDFDSALNRFHFRDANSKWRLDLDAQQREMLTRTLATHLERYGYDATRM